MTTDDMRDVNIKAQIDEFNEKLSARLNDAKFRIRDNYYVEDFCDEFGYNDLPLSAYKGTKKTYKAVCKEFEAVKRLFGDVIDELCEIS